GAIQSFADGASTGGRTDLTIKDARWRVDVGWTTGEVRSGPLRTPAP
ncbi:type II secretion system protein XpsH, partial [Xanthomonas campestris]